MINTKIMESTWHKLKVKVKKALGMKVILCDSCKWDWRGACHNPSRPNATWCSEYKSRYR